MIRLVEVGENCGRAPVEFRFSNAPPGSWSVDKLFVVAGATCDSNLAGDRRRSKVRHVTVSSRQCRL